MARAAKKQKEMKRVKLVDKHAKMRKNFKSIILSPHSTDDEKLDAELKLQKLPRDSSASRLRNRCNLCGRSRAYNRLTGLCRIHMRHAVMNGYVPGMHKASW